MWVWVRGTLEREGADECDQGKCQADESLTNNYHFTPIRTYDIVVLTRQYELMDPAACNYFHYLTTYYLLRRHLLNSNIFAPPPTNPWKWLPPERTKIQAFSARIQIIESLRLPDHGPTNDQVLPST